MKRFGNVYNGMQYSFSIFVNAFYIREENIIWNMLFDIKICYTFSFLLTSWTIL